MKKKTFMGITALLPLVLCDSAAMPVYAEVTDYQDVDTGINDEGSAECEVIYKSTYGFSEEIPKYPELEVSSSGYEGIYDGETHGINVDCKIDGAVILYSTDGKNYADKRPVYKDAGTYVTYYKAEKAGYAAVSGKETVRIKEAAIDYTSHDYSGIYDGKKHSIDLSVRTEGCKILYSEDGIKYTPKKPEYKGPGTYVVYYRIMKDNYVTVTGNSTVTIRADGNTTDSNVSDNSNQDDDRNQNNGSKCDSSADGSTDNGVSKVQTGDENNILFYGAMPIASVFGMAKSKRRKEKENPKNNSR